MILVKLKRSNSLIDVLPVILDDAMARKDNHIVLLANKGEIDNVRLALNSHKKIGRVLMGSDTVYCIKDMRIEIAEIEYEI